MKKLVMLFVSACVAIGLQAASTDWALTCGNMKDHSGNPFSGTYELYATGGDLTGAVLVYKNASSGATYNKADITVTDTLTADQSYSFYYVITDSAGYQFTSETKGPFKALATGAQSIGFGNQATATSNANNWAAVPEPTSALLMVLGIAGLALKRKRA